MAETTTDIGSSVPLVLVADDDPSIRALISYRLESLGYLVVTAEDGEEAVRLANRHRPAVVVVDWMMPKLDGLGVVRQLRAAAETAQTLIILLTARVQDADIARGYEAGVDDYVGKPFSPNELGVRVKALLAART